MNESSQPQTTDALLKQARQAYYRLHYSIDEGERANLQTQRDFILWAQTVQDALALHNVALLREQLGATQLGTFLANQQLQPATRRLLQAVLTALVTIAEQQQRNARWPQEMAAAAKLITGVRADANDLSADLPAAQQERLQKVAAESERRQATLARVQHQIGLTQADDGDREQVRAALVAPRAAVEPATPAEEANDAATLPAATGDTAEWESPTTDLADRAAPTYAAAAAASTEGTEFNGTVVLPPASDGQAAPAIDRPPASDDAAAALDPIDAALAEALRADIELFAVDPADLAGRLRFTVATIVAERERARTEALLADLQARKEAAANDLATNVNNFESTVRRLNSSVIDTANRFNLLDDRIRNADGTVAGIENRLTEAETRLNKLKDALPVDKSGLESWQKSGLAARWQQVNFEQGDLRSLIIDTDQYRKKAFNEPELAAAMLQVLQNVDNRIDPQIRGWADDKHNSVASLPFEFVDRHQAQFAYAVWRARFPLPSSARATTTFNDGTSRP